MAGGFTEFDSKEWNQALGMYKAATGKDVADVSNRAMMNLGFQGVKHASKAERSAIKAVQGSEWWVRYVAKNLGIKKRGARVPARTVKRRDSRTGKTRLVRLPAAGYKKVKGRGRSVEAGKLSRQWMKSRVKAIGFIRMFFGFVAREFAKVYDPTRKITLKLRSKNFTLAMVPATPKKPNASFLAMFS